MRYKTSKINYPLQLNIRVNDEIINDLEKITLFERRKRSDLIRQWVMEKIQTYKRRPDFKKFLKLLKETEEARKYEFT